MAVRIYNLADRNIIVKAINDETVVFDVIFTRNDARDVQTLKDEFPNLPLDTQRNPQRNLACSLPDMALRLAQQGHYMSAPTVSTRKIVYQTVSNYGIKL